MRSIILDFGNVVGFFDHNRTFDRLQAHTSLCRQAMYDCVYGADLEDRFEKGHVDEPEFLRQVLDLWKLGCDEKHLAEAMADIFTPNPEICELIPRLAKRYRLLLGSNTNIIHARKFRNQFEEVLGHFHHLVLSCEVRARKPHAEFYEECLRHAQAAPQECLFVDDLPPNIEGARKLGMKGLLYQPGNGLHEELRALGVDV